jgi:hypothetical protein
VHDSSGTVCYFTGTGPQGAGLRSTCNTTCAACKKAVHQLLSITMRLPQHCSGLILTKRSSYGTGPVRATLLCQPGSGPALVSKLQNNVISRVQYLFLRTIAGRVRKSTCRMFLSREFGAQPLVCSWLRAALAMWNRAVEAGDTCLLGRAMRDNMRLSQTSSSGSLWCRQLQRVLSLPGGRFPIFRREVRGLSRVRVSISGLYSGISGGGAGRVK